MARNTTGAKPGKERKPKTTSGPVTKTTPLNAKQMRFVDEYLIDLNGTQAAIRTGYAAGSADVTAARLLADDRVKALVQERMAAREQRTEITQDLVLKRWWEIASADAAELTAVHYRCCRHCYGDDHAYQWIDENEFERAVANAEANELTPPTGEGGYGFNPTLTPHAKCPKCFGEGHIHVHLADTRSLSGAGRLLFDGVKETKFGIEIKVQDRAKALENIARHLGMFKLDVNHGVDPENPLASLMAELAGKVLKPVVE